MEELWETAEVSDGSVRIGTAHYSLTSGTCEVLSTETYGVSVTLQREGGAVERCAIEDICCTKGGAQALLRLLCRHTVTPVTLRDVVEDYLAAL